MGSCRKAIGGWAVAEGEMAVAKPPELGRSVLAFSSGSRVQFSYGLLCSALAFAALVSSPLFLSLSFKGPVGALGGEQTNALKGSS